MSVMYVSASFSSYKPLKFETLSYTAEFLLGMYCTSYLKLTPKVFRATSEQHQIILVLTTFICFKQGGFFQWLGVIALLAAFLDYIVHGMAPLALPCGS